MPIGKHRSISSVSVRTTAPGCALAPAQDAIRPAQDTIRPAQALATIAGCALCGRSVALLPNSNAETCSYVAHPCHGGRFNRPAQQGG